MSPHNFGDNYASSGLRRILNKEKPHKIGEPPGILKQQPKQRFNNNKFEKKQSVSNHPPIYKTGIESQIFGITTHNFFPFRLTGITDSDQIRFKAHYIVNSSIKERLG